jgi:hypothetical protein
MDDTITTVKGRRWGRKGAQAADGSGTRRAMRATDR